jgi:hypothetical protein
MPARLRQPVLLAASALLAAALSGCGTVNEKMSETMGDYIPQWAGGLPKDAPPRPGTAKYDAYMAERERLRQMPAADRPGAEQQGQSQPGQQQQPPSQQQQQQPQQNQARATPSGLDPVH